MTRITDATVTPYQAPLKRTYVSATAHHDTREGLLVTLDTSTGHRSLGEAAPLSNRTEPLARARQALEQATQRLATEQPPLDEAHATLDSLSPLLDQAPTARFALSTALHAAAAHEHDTPLSQHLHETHNTPHPPPEAVPVNATIPAQDPPRTGHDAKALTQRGFDTIKLKATGSWDEDLDRVHHAREHAPSANLRLDVNGSWPDAATAETRLHELAPYNLEYIEQPLPPDDLDGMARLEQAEIVPIAADEPLTSPQKARRILDADAADVLVLKPMVLGTLEETLRAAEHARGAHTPVVITSTIDGAIARAAALHTAAALGPRELACGLATGALLETEPAAYDERIHDGQLLVPTAPGTSAWINPSPRAP